MAHDNRRLLRRPARSAARKGLAKRAGAAHSWAPDKHRIAR